MLESNEKEAGEFVQDDGNTGGTERLWKSQRSCGEKIQYHSMQEAREAAEGQRIRKKDEEKYRHRKENYMEYLCEYCDYWHVGRGKIGPVAVKIRWRTKD